MKTGHAPSGPSDLELAQWALDCARAKGASAVEVLTLTAEALNAGVRLGEVEKLKSSRERRVGLRVFVGKSSACASTAELSQDGLERFIEDTIALARVTAADPWSGLPAPELHPREIPELKLEDAKHGVIGAERALEMARRAEQAAVTSHPSITNSEGAEFSSGWHRLTLVNSQGFCAAYNATSYSLVVIPIAQASGSMQRDYWYSAARHYERLKPPEEVGAIAGQRARRRLGARKVRTCKVPVIFDSETASSLLGNVAAAVCGHALYTGASFLKDKLGARIAAPTVSLIDDPTLVGALGSKPFDGEGAASHPKSLITQGYLKSYLLDSYSARKLGLTSTGNASRTIGGPPSAAPTNLYLEPGPHSPQEIIGSVKRGLLVTELIGFGVNLVTGDYSRGAVGFWIEDGELAYPVEEITIAGNLAQMMRDIEMIGNDLEWRSSVASPTVKIAEMTVAGA
jgi:PmbA protein